MSERLGIYSERELEAARLVVRELIRVVRSFRLYEGNHPTLDGMQKALRRTWEQATAGGPLSLRLTERKVLLQDEPVHTSTASNDVIPCALYEHGVVGLVLKRGLEPAEAYRLVEVLSCEPDPSIDYASLLWEADLKHVQVLLDSDDLDDDLPTTPEEFAQQLKTLSEPGDPRAGADYDKERAELAARVAESGAADPVADKDRFALTEGERLYVARMLENDHYLSTVRHATRLVHAMVRDEIDADEAASLEKALQALLVAVISAGDLEGALEIARRGGDMARSEHPAEMHLGELTVELLQDKEALSAFLRGLEDHSYLDTRTLNEFLAAIGPNAAPVVAMWLLETEKYADVLAPTFRMYGPASTRVLVPLYAKADPDGRKRIASALLEIGTPDALVALIPEFDDLPEESRLQILHLVGRNTDPSLRQVIFHALADRSDRVRHAAIGSVRRADAMGLAPIVTEMLAEGDLERWPEEEVVDFLEMLSRVGDISIAKALAEYSAPKSFWKGLKKLSPLQEACVRALRRMRSADARQVVENLRQKGPRTVRDILDEEPA